MTAVATPITHFLDGDATIAGSHTAHLVWSAIAGGPLTINDGTRLAGIAAGTQPPRDKPIKLPVLALGDGKTKAVAKMADGKHLANKKGVRVCQHLNPGTCGGDRHVRPGKRPEISVSTISATCALDRIPLIPEHAPGRIHHKGSSRAKHQAKARGVKGGTR